mmetsp:Transcript_37600/g.67722  ORF Transcript_37600/g.67722 Transcript_37600/m.67722 type:complete len:148 (+) Transcript_37600:185-628(+)
MAPLKQHLESTGSQVPDRLARHPVAFLGLAMRSSVARIPSFSPLFITFFPFNTNGKAAVTLGQKILTKLRRLQKKQLFSVFDSPQWIDVLSVFLKCPHESDLFPIQAFIAMNPWPSCNPHTMQNKYINACHSGNNSKMHRLFLSPSS